MAYSWIKIDNHIKDKPEVRRLTRILELSSAWETVGILCQFWSYFDEFTTDGTINAEPEDIDDIIGVEGLCRALESVDWLIIQDGIIAVPSFDEHHSVSAKQRAVDSKRRRDERRNPKHDNDKRKPPDKSRTKVGHKSDKSRTDSGRNLDLEEKRREENKKEEIPPIVPQGGRHVFAEVFAEMDSLDPLAKLEPRGGITPAQGQAEAAKFIARWNSIPHLIPISEQEFENDRRLSTEFQDWLRVPGRWQKLEAAMTKLEKGPLALGDKWKQMRKVLGDPNVVEGILSDQFGKKSKLGSRETCDKGTRTKERSLTMQIRKSPIVAAR